MAGFLRALPYGPNAVLLETDVADVPRLLAAVRGLPGVVEAVPGACTVLVRHGLDPAAAQDLAGRAEVALGAPDDGGPAPGDGPVVEIDVVYDGADLAHVAEHAGLMVRDVVAAHAGAEYVSVFCGFAPGFAYLSGLPEELHLPRRSTPRTRVPAGSVAVAGGWTGVYPTPSPGGWHLLGRTDAVLWDVTRDSPALLPPGTRVRFRPVRS